jgi:exodeoxyribonuclease VII large subunit
MGYGAIMRRFTVKSLNADIDSTLAARYSTIIVEGEIGELKTPSSGHCYMTLRDQEAALSAVAWRSVWQTATYKPTVGERVVIRGRVRVYVPRGVYQLYVHDIRPAGAGALAKEIAARIARLTADGLLDPRRKRALPVFPKVIGVVTSLTGAALQDFLKVSGERLPSARILVAGSVVQGETAPASLIRALELLQEDGRCELIVLTRGGGAKEHLMAFQDEFLARAIAHCSVPVVSAVGHQVDTTIADLVADGVAPTPSAAALLVCPDGFALGQRVDESMASLEDGAARWLQRHRRQLAHLNARLRHPGAALIEIRLRCVDLMRRLSDAWQHRILMQRKATVEQLHARLAALSPEQVLSRGYAIVRHQGRVLEEASSVSSGERLDIHLKKGVVKAVVG